MEIHVLKAQGLSERQIARQLGISRNTVARYLEWPQMPRYKMRPTRLTKLDPFKTYIEKRIAQAKPEWIPAPAIVARAASVGLYRPDSAVAGVHELLQASAEGRSGRAL